MSKKRKHRKQKRVSAALIRVIAAAVCLAAAFGLLALARQTGWFADWHTTHVYPLFVGTLGRFCDLFRFSVVEILLYALIVTVLITLVVSAVRVGKNLHAKRGKKAFAPLGHWASHVVLTAVALFLLYVLTCGINYERTAFSAEAGLHRQPVSTEDLRLTCEVLIAEVNAEVAAVPFDEAGSSVMPEDGEAIAKVCMERLSENYPCLQGFYPHPKGLLVSRILSVQELAGVYSPFTVEANYNREMPTLEKPLTLCHELSHLRGFMREDEANFIAYLACRTSDNAVFRYAGSQIALTHCLNAYYRAAGADRYWEVYAQLDERAVQDRRLQAQWWDQFEGPIAETSQKVNDSYLKANNQTEGVKSYGRMVDLLVAYVKENR